MAVVTSDAAIHAVLMDWTLDDDDAKTHEKAQGAARLHPRPQRSDSDLPDGRAQRFGAAADRSHAAGRRVHLDARGHRVVRQRSRRGRGAPLHRAVAAAVRCGARSLRARPRILVAHAGSRRRHGVPEVAGRARLLRLLRRKPAALGPVDQRRRARFAARPHRADRRIGEVRGAGVRCAPDVLRDERHVDREPADLHGGGHARSDRAVRSQLPQVDRARARC